MIGWFITLTDGFAEKARDFFIRLALLILDVMTLGITYYFRVYSGRCGDDKCRARVRYTYVNCSPCDPNPLSIHMWTQTYRCRSCGRYGHNYYV